jgi:hypothetical protein
MSKASSMPTLAQTTEASAGGLATARSVIRLPHVGSSEPLDRKDPPQQHASRRLTASALAHGRSCLCHRAISDHPASS